MARRRRKGNPLMVRILLIAVGIHIIVLPILAYFGAFKKIEMSMRHEVDMVVLPPPPHIKQPEVKKEVKKAVHAASKGPAKAQRGEQLRQHVIAPPAAPGNGGGGSGPEVNNPDKGFAPGTLPPSGPPKGNAPVNPGNETPHSAPATAPPPPPTAIKPTPTVAAAPPVIKPHVPVVVDVAATYDPSPVIPDDLRADDIDTTVTAQFLVSSEGSPTDVKILKSSGNDELDQIALDTAKKWKFKPATSDGTPIESRVILHIEFQVQ